MQPEARRPARPSQAAGRSEPTTKEEISDASDEECCNDPDRRAAGVAWKQRCGTDLTRLPRPERAADPGAAAAGLHRARRAQRDAAAAFPGHGARCRAERAARPRRRPRLRRHEHLRRSHRHPVLRPHGRPGAVLQQLPHHRSVLADAGRAQKRSQPPRQQHGLDHRDRHGLPRQHRQDSRRGRAPRRDAAPQRLQHRCLRQVARARCVGGEHRRSLRPLADPPGLRQVLRLPRRRDQPVGALHLRRHPCGRAAGRPRIPLHDRHDRPDRGLDQVPAGAGAGQAVLRLLRAGSDARPAPRAAGMDRALEGEVRPGLGPPAGGDPGAPDRARRRARGHPARAQAVGHPRLVHPERRREETVRPPGRGVRRLRRDDRPRDRPPRADDRGDRRARQHARHPGLRGQRHLGGGRPQRHVQRDDLFQRRPGDGARHARKDRSLGWTRNLPPHGRGLGSGL